MKLGKTLLIALTCSVAAATGTFFALQSVISGEASVTMRDVPQLAGMSDTTAQQLLESKDLRLAIFEHRPSTKPKGQVLAHVPRAGSRVETGTVVYVIVSTGSAVQPVVSPAGNTTKPPAAAPGVSSNGRGTNSPIAGTAPPSPTTTAAPQGTSKLVEVPQLIGRTLGHARKQLRAAGLTVGVLRRLADEDRAHGTILRQRPRAGAKVTAGSGIALWLNDTN